MNCRPIIGNDDGITFLGNTSETVVDEKLVREHHPDVIRPSQVHVRANSLTQKGHEK